jgi:hypothetical protein
VVWLSQPEPPLNHISEAEADPDRDGMSNLLEFVFDLIPTESEASPMVSTLSEDYLTLEFYRLDESEAETTLTVEVSTDLMTWTSHTIGAMSSTSSSIIITFNERDDNPDEVTVRIPRGTSTRALSRLSAEVD